MNIIVENNINILKFFFLIIYLFILIKLYYSNF